MPIVLGKVFFWNNFPSAWVPSEAAQAIEWTQPMCQSVTRVPGRSLLRLIGLGAAGLLAAVTPQVWAQDPASVRLDWRHIGNSAIELALPGPASGPVERVWYSSDGGRLHARTPDGRVFETGDFEKWLPSTAAPPAGASGQAAESGPGVRTSALDPSRLYVFGAQVLRSDDGGLTWQNLTGLGRRSILGGAASDLAVSPRAPEEIVVANDRGVWRSLDGGTSWAGLNETLPNLPGTRIDALPRGTGGVRLRAGDLGVLEWAPGEKQAWRPVTDPAAAEEEAARGRLSGTLGVQVTAMAAAEEVQYAGSSDGRLWVSIDRGRSWVGSQPAARGPVAAIWVDAQEPRIAAAALGRDSRGPSGPRVLRTMNTGQFWDDVTMDLPEGSAHGIAADRATGTVYLATDRGVFLTRSDLGAAGPATPWSALSGLPTARALDLRLDAAGNQLFVAVEGYGVYAALAPHRGASLRLVNAADLSQRPAAPGSLLSVLGGHVLAARAGDLTFPVLAASETESQIQVPFSARGPSVWLALETGAGSRSLAVPVEEVSPAIFVDRDGTPLLLDADSGLLLDAMNTAHSNARIQILATGLGRVRPDWPAGVAGPLESPPQVVAPVRAYLDRAPVEVTRAILAPGYVGLYLVEVQLPALVNAGPAELYIAQENQQSNRVRIWIEP
ncbi:MAG: hypothetical protein ABSD56_14460 [Bryobacteraceae bacterium]